MSEAASQMEANQSQQQSRIPYSTSVVIPTYQEAKNIELLISRLASVRERFDEFEVILVDDNSQDGTEEIVERLRANGMDWLRLVVRKDERGLSTAVVRGFEVASFSNLVCMDADLSHPPEVIPRLIERLHHGETDFVIGSRYVEGGKIHGDWSVKRWLNSQISTWLARPFTTAKDPMSGFFALRKDTFKSADELNPIGYKIGLELLVKGHCQHVAEVPIFFGERYEGESKIEGAGSHLREVWRYLRHIKRLADYKYGILSQLIHFSLVGGVGTLFNLVILTLMLAGGVGVKVSVASAILVALIHNFVLTEVLMFREKRTMSLVSLFVFYFLSTAAGNLANYLVTTELILGGAWVPQVAALVGVASGMIINFLGKRYSIYKTA